MTYTRVIVLVARTYSNKNSTAILTVGLCDVLHETIGCGSLKLTPYSFL
jgi:hypothetical protein